MKWHIALIYLLVMLYLTNDLLEIFSDPMIFLIWENDPEGALIVSQYIRFIVVAVIDFFLALALLYLFKKMSSAMYNRDLKQS